MITDEGTMIRTSVSEIPTYRRNASGVIVMRLSDGANVVNMAVAKKQETPSDTADPDAEPSTDATAPKSE